MADQVQQSQETTISNPNIAVESAKPAEGEKTQQQVVYEPSSKPGGFYWGTGRRKTSCARVRVRPGSGKIEINGRGVEDYFHEDKDRNAVMAPLVATDNVGKFDVFVNVNGGGFTGQAGAILLGLSRALLTINDAFESTLRDNGYLTRDSRMKERKKYGQKGARKRFQFSKR